MIASLSLESLNSLTTPLRSSQGLVWLGAVQENTHRAGNAIYAPQSQAGSRIARRVMLRVTAGARAVTPPVMLPGPGSWDVTQKTAGDVFTSLWGNWQPSIDPDICFHTLCFVSYNILLFLRYRGWHWTRFRCRGITWLWLRHSVLRRRVETELLAMIASLSDIPRLSLTSHMRPGNGQDPCLAAIIRTHIENHSPPPAAASPHPIKAELLIRTQTHGAQTPAHRWVECNQSAGSLLFAANIRLWCLIVVTDVTGSDVNTSHVQLTPAQATLRHWADTSHLVTIISWAAGVAPEQFAHWLLASAGSPSH